MHSVAYWTRLNSLLVCLRQCAVSAPGFSFPLFMTMGHLVFSFVVLAPFMVAKPFISLHHATLRKQWKGVMCIGACMALNIALNNLSLVEITLSLNQVIRWACFSCQLRLC